MGAQVGDWQPALASVRDELVQRFDVRNGQLAELLGLCGTSAERLRELRESQDEIRNLLDKHLPAIDRRTETIQETTERIEEKLDGLIVSRPVSPSLERSEHATARQQYERALPLFEQVGSLLGQANCIRSLGDIAAKESRGDEAHGLCLQALDLYVRIPEPYSIGTTHFRLALLADDAAERRRHVEAARTAWQSIDRPDLVARLDREFGEPRS